MAPPEQTTDGGIPLTELEQRIWADIDWAEQDEQVRTRYAGEWVAIYHKNIVAHGTDRAQVLRDAMAVTRQPVQELAVWPIDPLMGFDTNNPVPPDEL